MASTRTDDLLSGSTFEEASDLAAWTQVSGAWEIVTSDDGTSPVQGSSFVKPTDASVSPAELSQVIDLTAVPGFDINSVDVGLARSTLAGVHCGRSSDNDNQRFIVEALDGLDVLISTVSDSGTLDTTTNAWSHYTSGPVDLPTGTRKLRVRLVATKLTSTSGFDSYFDILRLYVEERPRTARDTPLYAGLTYFNKFDSSDPTEKELALDRQVGTFTGTAGRTGSGQYGGAYQSGAAGDSLETPDYPEIRTDPTSVAAWVYMDVLPSSMFGVAPRIIVAKGDGVANGYFLGCIDGTDDIRFRVVDQALSVYEAVYTAVPADVGQWIHFVGTQDASSVSLYKDGALVETNLVSGDIGQDPAEPMVVGLNWEGRIDEVATWNRHLSPSNAEGVDEIQEAMLEMEFPDTPDLGYPPGGSRYLDFNFPFSLEKFLNTESNGFIDADSFALFAADGTSSVSPRATTFAPIFRGVPLFNGSPTVTLLGTGGRAVLPFAPSWDPRGGGWDSSAYRVRITKADDGRSFQFQGRISPTAALGSLRDIRLVLVKDGVDVTEVGLVSDTGTPELHLDISLDAVEGEEFWLEAYLASGSDLEITPDEFLVHRILDEWTLSSVGSNSVLAAAAHLTQQQWIVTDGAGHVWRSYDGIEWSDLGAVHGGALHAVAIDQDNDRIVVAGTGGGIYTSDDLGASWTGRTSQFGVDTIRSLSWDRSGFTAVGDNGKISTSPLGATWTARTSGVATSLRAVATSDSDLSLRRVAVGASGVALYSDDTGATWQATASPGVGTDTLLGVGYDAAIGRWAACGVNGHIIYSDDPSSSWSSAFIPDGFLGLDWAAVHHGASGSWITVSSSGETMASFMADRWIGITSGLEGKVGTTAVSQPRFRPASFFSDIFAASIEFFVGDQVGLGFPSFPELPYTDSPFQFLLVPRDPDPSITSSSVDCLLGVLDAAAQFGPSDSLSVTRYWEVEIVPDEAYMRIGESGDVPISPDNNTNLTLNFVFPDGINLGGKRIRYVIYPNTFCGAIQWVSPWVELPDCGDGGGGGPPTPGHGNVVLADLLVINIYDPELTSPYIVKREPDIDTTTAVTFYWTGLQLAEDDPPPELVNYQQRPLVIKELLPGRYRFRFTAHFTTEILQQDFVLFVRPETFEGNV